MVILKDTFHDFSQEVASSILARGSYIPLNTVTKKRKWLFLHSVNYCTVEIGKTSKTAKIRRHQISIVKRITRSERNFNFRSKNIG